MARKTGVFHTSIVGGEKVQAFVPNPLLPRNPVLRAEGEMAERHSDAMAAIHQLEIASAMMPSSSWFLYGFELLHQT
jgi:hypothetical protein